MPILSSLVKHWLFPTCMQSHLYANNPRFSGHLWIFSGRLSTTAAVVNNLTLYILALLFVVLGLA